MTRRMPGRSLVRAVAVALVAMFLAGSPAVNVSPIGATDPLPERYVLRDALTGATLLVNLDPESERPGGFTFTEPGTGMVWPDGQATIVPGIGGQVAMSYNGPGQQDEQARLDPVFALHQGSGNATPVQVSLVAALDTAAVTGTATVIVDDQVHVLADLGTLPGADELVADVVSATRDEDWSALWLLMAASFKEGTDEAEFVTGVAAGFAPLGHIVDVTTGALVHLDGRPGFDLATVPITAVLEQTDGTQTEVTAVLGMTWDGGQWAVLTISATP